MAYNRKAADKKYRESVNGRATFKTWRKSPTGRAFRLREAQNRRNRNKIWVNKLKIEKGCIDCGFNKWAESLDFDHKNRNNKTFSISQRLLRAKKTLLKEIKKCVVRCANCHRHKTKKEILK